jgi:predicted dehydrogenase
LLGTAHINRRLIPAMREARRSELVAVASRDAARAQAYGREWQIAVTHGNYEALLRDRSVDAIYIPLPNSLHVEWTLRALDAGKHVLCEKPLALDAEDVDRIAAVARARSLVVAEAFMYRHEPLIARVVDLVRGGAVGDPWLIDSGFTYQQTRERDVRLEAFNGLLRFPAGVVASIHCSFRASYRTWLDIHGRDGTLRVANPFRPAPSDVIDVQRGNDVHHVTVEGSSQLFVRQVDDFVAAALDGRPSTVTLDESRGNAAALAALAAAAKSGQAVTV